MANTDPNPRPTHFDPATLQRHPQSDRPPDHLSATDEERPTDALKEARSSPPKAPFDVFTPKGFRPFYPEEPEPNVSSTETPPADNPFNPRGGPSLSLPQQATPLTSDQGVLSVEEMADPALYNEIVTAQDGLAPDDPRNPRGTPDYIVEEPSPQSNPDDMQHDGRTSHTSPETLPEAKYWEDENPNAETPR